MKTDVRFSINGGQLKIIAVIAMFADHLCKCLFPDTVAGDIIVCTVGRMAMPIFIYLLSEGFFYTRNRAKYFRNLLLTAVVAEVIFDLAFYGTPFYLGHQNTCFTLALGLLMMILVEKARIEVGRVAEIIVLGGFLLVFYFTGVDYGLSAGIAIAAAYYFRNFPVYVSAIAICAVIAAGTGMPGALLALIPLLFYRHERGNVSAGMKWFFYIFYPGHLLLLYLLQQLF